MTVTYLWEMAVEIVSFPSNIVIFHGYLNLPDGNITAEVMIVHGYLIHVPL